MWWNPKYQLQDVRQLAQENRKMAESFFTLAQDMFTDLGEKAFDQWTQQTAAQADLSRAWLKANRDGMLELQKITKTGLRMMEGWSFAAQAPVQQAAKKETGIAAAPKKTPRKATPPPRATVKATPKTARTTPKATDRTTAKASSRTAAKSRAKPIAKRAAENAAGAAGKK